MMMERNTIENFTGKKSKWRVKIIAEKEEEKQNWKGRNRR